MLLTSVYSLVTVIIACVVMIILFGSFFFAYSISQQKKIKYHKDLQALHDEQQQTLMQQNLLLEEKVAERTSELSQQKQIVEEALTELKATQSQLIHRERMASLGELTAGIAHEIQNPLNFVNNFSDVNVELSEELKTELTAGNQQEALSIANDIQENSQKINHHGKRADAIVKGMLQHSRSTTGDKEPTDINALANEYLKLSYHGIRAKDNSFNAKLVTGFDESIGKINIIPQEIGRLLLNLYNNAFYALAEKITSAPAGYEPAITLVTKQLPKAVEIKIRDNGMGIPKELADKVFQPFYTTKPSGEGTGLGLSLSYEIVQGHGGKITLQSEAGMYTEFIIQLPV